MPSLTSLLAASAALFTAVRSHTVLTYPGWRGDNLRTTGYVENNTDFPIPEGALSVNYDKDGNVTFPYGMQWVYPCEWKALPDRQ